MTSTSVPIPLLTELCASVRELLDAKGCLCAVVDASGETLEFVAGDGPGMELLVGQQVRLGEGISGYVAQAGVPVEVPQVSADDRWLPRLSTRAGYVPTGFISVPVTDGSGRVVGVLNVLDPSPEVAAAANSAVGGVLPALAVVAAEVSALIA